MKTLLLFALCISIIACSPKEQAVTEINVSGHIENAKGDSIIFIKGGEISKFAVDTTGNFSGTLEGEGYYTFSYSRERTTCFLNPGDSLKLNFDTKEFDESMSYEGSSEDVNNYLATKFLLIEEQGKNLSMRDLYSMPEDSFSMSLNEAKQEVIALLNSTELDEGFKSIENTNIKYEYLSNAQNFETYHKYFAKNDSFEVSEEYNKQFEGIDYTNEGDFAMVPKYHDMVMSHYANGDLTESLENLQTLESVVIKEDVIERLTNWLSPGTEDLLDRVNEMKAMVVSEDLISSLDEKYESMKVLTKGNVSPVFNFKNTSGDMVSLSDLKGKNVYIDVWATWCGPCKAEIPHLKTLEGEYHGKNIEFVSISVDVPKDEQKWKDMVADKELKGIQLMSDNGWDTDFVDNYLIRGIPRFILLDGDGNIVSADAPRPSSDSEIKEMIEALL